MNDVNYALFTGLGLIFFVLLMIWSLVWKGLALWRAARNGHTAWYIILLIINSGGILDIIYYFAIGDQTKK